MNTRRDFLRFGARSGLAAASMPLLFSTIARRAFASAPDPYKALVLIELYGGNDANNMVIPIDTHEYTQYQNVRSVLALAENAIIPLNGTAGAPNYGVHWALPNIASLYNNRKALVVANVGPLRQPVTKQQLLANPNLAPSSLFSHAAGRAQWECASADNNPQLGWGGRVADLLTAQSGQLPPILTAGLDAVFTVGQSVQGVSMQASNGSYIPVPAGLNTAMVNFAQRDCQAANDLVAHTAQLRLASMQQQTTLQSAFQAGSTLSTTFSNTAFGNVLKAIAQVINGRSAIGANRQIFFCQQGSYDSHVAQIQGQAENYRDLDTNIGLFMLALAEMGLSDKVLLCTHSDFGRSCQANTGAGTDHGWGNHQLLIGGGIRGGQLLGTMPDLELGGACDFNGDGIWIPTTAVTQLTAGVASWMGLSANQVSSVFPDLGGFPSGALNLS